MAFYNPSYPYNNPYLQGAYANYGMPQMQGVPQVGQSPYTAPPQPKTNKIFVTSLEDAINRTTEPNSEVMYLHQDQPILFEIKTDAQGRKTYNTYNITLNTPQGAQNAPKTGETPTDVYITRQEFEGVQGEIRALNERVEIILKGQVNNEPIE